MQLSPSPWRYNASSGYVSDAAGRVVVWTDKPADGETIARTPEMVELLWALVSGEGRSTDQIIDMAAAICHQLGGAGGDVEELPQRGDPGGPALPDLRHRAKRARAEGLLPGRARGGGAMKPDKAFWHAVADRVEQGWCQGAYFDGEANCLLGAIAWYFGWNTDSCIFSDQPEFMRAVRVIEAKVGSVVNWNDAPGREKYEVVDLCRKLAEEAPL